jgi:uncharacterized protein (TIGR03437 family)
MNRLMCAAVGVSVLCLFAPKAAQAQTPVTVTYSYSGLPLPIYGDSADIITVATVLVPQALKTTAVTARLKIEYPNTGDLKIYLYSPFGTRTVLLEHDCAVANVDTTFDDSAPSLWKDFCPSEAGRGPFKADQPLSNFNSDDNSFGTWRLAVENDRSDSRSGWIRELSLTITGTSLTSPVFRSETVGNAASLTGTAAVAPGELVSIYGIGLGPVTAVSAPSGALPATLGGATVTFNGIAAPIAYASRYRLDVQAPFNLAAGTQVNAQVTTNGAASALAPINVLDVVPGIYTLGPAGTGRIKAVNQDGSMNSDVSPATKGTVIIIYASGLGTVSPTLTEGAVPPATPLSTVTHTLSAVIGGISAPVLYAGAAPGFPGLYQINLRIPTDAPSGSQKVTIYSGGQGSQDNATISIR